MRMVASNDNNAPMGAAGRVGGASPAPSVSPALKEVYLIDPYGYLYPPKVDVDEYIIVRRKAKGITDKYVAGILEGLVLEYLNELDKCETLKRLEEEAWEEGCEHLAATLKEVTESRITSAKSELAEKTYKLLPVIWDELKEKQFTVVLADGRKFWADWKGELRIWKDEKWKVVELKERTQAPSISGRLEVRE
jgi:hypothetical protein